MLLFECSYCEDCDIIFDNRFISPDECPECGEEMKALVATDSYQQTGSDCIHHSRCMFYTPDNAKD